ncbi:MAG: type II secretion system protein [Candidatus Roizmanbacteria bacterium]
MKYSSSQKAFTLIELLVVIAIISALSALIFPNFMALREKARDTQRKSDLKQIQTAMELYKQNQDPPVYPTGIPDQTTCWSSEGFGASCLDSVVYLKNFPGDPNRLDGSGNAEGYYYSTTGDSYALCSCLENKVDPRGVSGNCDDTDYICESGKKYEMTPD